MSLKNFIRLVNSPVNPSPDVAFIQYQQISHLFMARFHCTAKVKYWYWRNCIAYFCFLLVLSKFSYIYLYNLIKFPPNLLNSLKVQRVCILFIITFLVLSLTTGLSIKTTLWKLRVCYHISSRLYRDPTNNRY